MFQRAILHLDLDAFFASVECLKNTSLQGKPLIIGGSSRRGVVASCSYEARAYGIHSAMPMRMARQLCPDAIIVKGDMEDYAKYSGLITDIIEDEAPLFEKASIDEFYLDLTGMDRHFGCYKWATELRQKIMQESGLPISMGLSINKLVSKVGTNEAKPKGSIQIEAGLERDFLAPLPVGKIPGIGQSMEQKLRLMGVRQVKTLREIPPRLLEREFGKSGRTLAQRANAIDHRPVVPFSERKSISTEQTFQIDTIDIPKLRQTLRQMTSKLAFQLRQKQRLTACVTVKIRYTDFNTYTRQARIPYTANERPLVEQVLHLFDKLYQRRQLIRLVGVRFSHLVAGAPQLNLFDDNLEEIHLQQQMDRIRKRFGEGAIRWGTSKQQANPSKDSFTQ